MQFNRNALEKMEKRYRAQFVNSLSGFKSANLVGTQGRSGRYNLAIVSSVFHLGANPPLMGMISRPRSVERHTLNNLLETGYYTLNHVSDGMVRPAHQSSARYPESVSEFEAVGLTAEPSGSFPAPYVKESRIKLGLELVSTQTLCNATELVIGEIVEVRLPDEAVAADGYVDIESLGTVAVSGLDSYHTGRRLERLRYAKPDRPPEPL